jgi:hypothetical protein
MNDAPFAIRLFRALAILALGAAMHLPAPAVKDLPTLRAQPLAISLFELPRELPSVVLEQTDVIVRETVEVGGRLRDTRNERPVGTGGVVAATQIAIQRPGASPAVQLPDATVVATPPDSTAIAFEPAALEYEIPNPLAIEMRPAAPVTAAAAPPAPAPAPRAIQMSPHASPQASESEEDRVRQLIDQYAGALERFDVGAAQAVWPTVDGKALKRAFGQLSSQRLTLQSCGITISGSTANARCRGSATYQPRIGARDVQTASIDWAFALSKQDAAWRIVNTLVR